MTQSKRVVLFVAIGVIVFGLGVWRISSYRAASSHYGKVSETHNPGLSTYPVPRAHRLLEDSSGVRY